MKLNLVSSLLLVALFIAGCSNSNSTVNNPPGGGVTNVTVPATVIPKVGSTFIVNEFPIDTDGTPLTASQLIVHDSVVETGITYQGKTNVSHIHSTWLQTYNDTYINYESNGDVSIYVDNGPKWGVPATPMGWWRYPIQSHDTIYSSLLDTTYTVGQNTYHYIYGDTMRYAGAKQDTINGHSIVIVTFLKVYQTAQNVDGVYTVTDRYTSHISFAPEIGYLRRSLTDPLYYGPNTTGARGNEFTVLNYLVK